MLELTPQMLASDTPPNRLEQAKRKLLDLLQARRDAQTAIVVFAGSAHTLVPLSDDLVTSRNLLESLTPSIMPEPGRRADLALNLALQLLEQGGQGQGRILLIGSGLDQQERLGISQALGTRGARLHMLGIGSAEGAPIVQENGSLLKDAQGAILIPRLDSADLVRFARQIGARYRQASLDERDLDDLGLLAAPQQLRRDSEQTRLQTWADQGHWLLLPLLLLAACAGRRGWLFCLPLLLLGVPQTSYAFSFADLWWRADQQGQRLLEAQRPGEAATRFVDPQWQGLALYQAGDYPAAAERFARGDNAVAHYNRGNALARSNELEAALEAYDQALELQPDLLPAQTNKALIEQLLEQSQDEQNQQQDQEPEADSAPTPSQQPQAGSAEPDADKPAPAAGQSAPGDEEPAPSQPTPGDSDSPTPSEPDDDLPGEEQIASTAAPLDGERRQALEQWLRQIPDEPGELLRRKFWYEQQQRQELAR
jgi:Ca-activated chloride channel family protein